MDKEKLSYNIEFAHIYADERFDKEQIRSVERLHKFTSGLQRNSWVCTILIDDFYPTVSLLTEDELMSECERWGARPDFIGYESKFTTIADLLIDRLPKPVLKMRYFDQPESEVLVLSSGNASIDLRKKSENGVRHTCALLSASWLLCRLGVYKAPRDAIRSFKRKSFESELAYTILPSKYQPVEQKAKEIIKAAGFSNKIPFVEHEFFDLE